jgi:hypothetical protein
MLEDRRVATILSVSVATVRRWRLTSQGSRFRKFGGAVRYDIKRPFRVHSNSTLGFAVPLDDRTPALEAGIVMASSVLARQPGTALQINVGPVLWRFSDRHDYDSQGSTPWQVHRVTRSMTLCVDAAGRVCALDQHFARAAYPVLVYAVNDGGMSSAAGGPVEMSQEALEGV